MTEILVDADSCPVREEAVRVAERHGLRLYFVCNGWLASHPSPAATMVRVASKFDEVDKWIVARACPGDIVVTADIPLASKVISKGAFALKHSGEILTKSNIGARTAISNLLSATKPLDPFRRKHCERFTKADRSKFLDSMEKLVQKRIRAAGPGGS